MVSSKYRGHKMVELSDGTWVYLDNKEKVSNDIFRDCVKCGLPSTKEDHDGCLGTLKFAINACCGHGEMDEARIQFQNKFVLKGIFAIVLMKILRFELLMVRQK